MECSQYRNNLQLIPKFQPFSTSNQGIRLPRLTEIAAATIATILAPVLLKITCE